MPASFGVQGPGERTIASGLAAITSATEISSFRQTDTSAPKRAKIMGEIEGETIVIVDQRDNGHRILL